MESQLLKDIGYRIYARRKEMRLTQEELAEKIDVSVQMISNLELGKKAIRPDNLVKVCLALDVSADYVLMGKTSEQELGEQIKRLSLLSTEERRMIDQLIDYMLSKR